MEDVGVIDPGFWKGKRVFITGHTGFKGGWLSHWLVLLGASVRGFSLEPPTGPNLFHALGLEQDLDHTLGDIRDAEKLARGVAEFRPEIVFHLAAQPLVRRSYSEPRLTYETNVMGTVNLYEAVRSCESVHVVVCVTTDKCYENKEWLWGYRETDALGGYDPYSSSKACAELLTAAYRRSFFHPDLYGRNHHVAVATARAGNVIGGGDWAPDRLVPDCVKALSRNEAIVIRNPKATRPWQHVLEPLSGYLVLAQKMWSAGPRFSESWNFGPDSAGVCDVEQIVKYVIGLWGRGSYTIVPNEALHESHMLKLEIDKAAALLGWRPLYPVTVAIEKTIAWYRAYYEREDPRGLATKQCEEHLHSSLWGPRA